MKLAKEEFGFGDPSERKVKLSTYFEKYLKFSEATKAKNTALLDHHAQSVFLRFAGDVYISTITSKTVEEFMLHRITQVKPVSFNLEYRHLKAMFEKAVKWGHIKANPY